MKYKVEYGRPVYRGNYCRTKSRVYDKFKEVVLQVLKNPKVMLVERIGNRPEILFYWEEGWISDSMTKEEKRIVEKFDR
jgi:hypothetical protein